MNSLKSRAMKLRAVVADHAGAGVRRLLSGALEDELDVGLLHRFADLVMDDGARGAVEDRAEVVERAENVQVGDVDVPVLVRSLRLDEAAPLLRGRFVPPVDHARC